MEVLEYLKIRGNKRKVAKAVGVSGAYLSQSVKHGKISEQVKQKIVEYVSSNEPPRQG